MINQPTPSAASIIASGGVIAFRTDTFYGLGVDPLNALAIRKLRELKGREDTKPILLLISDREQVTRFVAETSPIFTRISLQYWPGPLTLIGIARPELPVELTAGSGTIGVRLPDEEEVCALVRACGGALTATSANLSGTPPARTAREVEKYFADRIDLILDRGEVTATAPSTVLDLTGEEPRVVREGAITFRESDLN
ncbi:MAG: L-threonylcarbamoyladenylate synthase [bacterium]